MYTSWVTQYVMRVDRVLWTGRLVTAPGTAGLPPFINAVGLLAGIQGSPDWSPEAQWITARLQPVASRILYTAPGFSPICRLRSDGS